MRSSARSAVSIDARDSLQPVDHAGRAAMAHEGMLQLGLVVEAIWPNAGCTRPVTQTTRGGPITRRGTLPPPPSPSNPLRHPLTRCGTPQHRRRRSWPAPEQKPKGGPGVGFEPPPHHPPSPLNPSTPCLQARARDGRAGGGGSAAESRGWATGEGTSQFQPRAVHASDAYRCWPPTI